MKKQSTTNNQNGNAMHDVGDKLIDPFTDEGLIELEQRMREVEKILDGTVKNTQGPVLMRLKVAKDEDANQKRGEIDLDTEEGRAEFERRMQELKPLFDKLTAMDAEPEID